MWLLKWLFENANITLRWLLKHVVTFPGSKLSPFANLSSSPSDQHAQALQQAL